ncbi:MAG: serine/threonine-protein kinase, partial [Planctomycetaceae bacterium]
MSESTHPETPDGSAWDPEAGPSPSSEDASSATAASATASSATAVENSDRTRRSAAERDDASTIDLTFLLPPVRDESLGRIGEYDVMRVEGCGGMGLVLKAFDQSLNRVVAIKVPVPQLASSQRFRERFLREARAVAAISHPNVVTVHAVGEQRGLPYLVMEYISGRGLRERIVNGAPMPLIDMLRIAMQVAEGLDAAHRRGVIHRDIKPSNIMLENGVERAKITDFGLARAAMDQSDLTSLGRMVGTPAWMSPEQVSGGPVDERSDLFALGCVMYAMATGHSPFTGRHTIDIIHKVIDLSPPPLSTAAADVPPQVSDLVARLLAKDPPDRYPSTAEVAAELGQILIAFQESRVSALPVASPLRGTRPAPPARLAQRVVVAVAAVVLLVVLGALFWNPGRTAHGPPRQDGVQPQARSETAEAVAVVDPRTAERRAADWA